MTDSPTPDAAKVTTLTNGEMARISNGFLTCEGTGWSVVRWAKDGKPTEFELCDFCGVKAAAEVVTVREAKAAAKALRDAADVIEKDTNLTVVAEGLRHQAHELDPPDRSTT